MIAAGFVAPERFVVPDVRAQNSVQWRLIPWAPAGPTRATFSLTL